jgi:hypothetical protein
MVQSLPPANTLKPNQIMVSVECPTEKQEQVANLVKLALRTRFFYFDDRDDVRFDRSDRQGYLKVAIVASHDSLAPKKEEGE